MSESWQPEESGIWHTRPSESSHPSFPFADHSVDPFWQPLSASKPIPPPPPPPERGVGQDDKPTEPVIGATLGMGIGVIVGALFAFVAVLVLGYVVLNGALASGNHSHPSSANSSSLASGGGTTPGGGGSSGSQGGAGGNPGGAGSSSPGVNATNGATPVPGTTPINVATPGASMTATTVAATTVAATGTALPPTATSTPAPLPLTVTTNAQDHKSIAMNVQTKGGASLTITVTYCDGSSDPKYNNYVTITASGAYSDTLNQHPKCKGTQSEGNIAVSAHLAGYRDATVTTAIQGG